ncbi:MAG: VOC family protein [Sphingobacteriaceae bacterium]|nr:VOC family protein [Sphingobacteriaceae bacterium]
MNAKQKIWANFGVKNVENTSRFYTQIGIKTNGINKDLKLVSFLFGEDNFVIHFFEHGSQIDEFLVKGANKEIIFTLSAETEQKVNEFADKVKSAGGKVLKEVRRDEAGYYGFAFADPDGHQFNMIVMDNL